ncbi:hypothetical protein [Ramlibacter rhizophilus]|uniref:Uncharacterized protein n=1 Tax=Ramlibacter rhizophilus TaxID=1781167 RepID=A0A4Z0C0P8_9BURK|nr:hypothetical protein [Ramlibacter rhizophilus]TFZ04492.1 hypothetical protein EZ242_01710 [Ramlibacter rhizophilus]
MSNPWLKKNPFMSMWLSAANSAAGTVRARASGAARRQGAAVQAQATRQVVDFWLGAPTQKPVRKKARR